MFGLFLKTLLVLFVLSLVFACSRTSGAKSEITAREGSEKVRQGALLVDVRTPEEFAEGHVPGALNIPYDEIGARVQELGPDKNREVVLYCRSGRRSGLAQRTLAELGFTHAYNAGGFSDWTEAHR